MKNSVSKVKIYCNTFLDDEARKGYYGKQKRIKQSEDEKYILSRSYNLKASATVTLKTKIKITQNLYDNNYYLTVKVNKTELTKSSKILTNLLAVLNSKEDIEALTIEALTKT